ncbi:MAG: chromate transporter, partial [Acidimicrobiales bacterium]
PDDFEDGLAACNLLPGPASTQLAIFCAWRLRGVRGALVGGACFIVPGLALIIVLSALFLAAHPPLWIEGAAAGAGAAVPAVTLRASLLLVPASWKRTGGGGGAGIRWVVYFVVGAVAASTVGALLVVVLALSGANEILATTTRRGGQRLTSVVVVVPLLSAATAAGAVGALAWVAFKVGALSYGGGFVIIPLMQHDAVTTYHWMSGGQFLNAVALGQVTPGPVVQTVAVVGYAASGVGGALLAAAIAFAPSFVFVIVGGPHFDRIRRSGMVQAFLTGAGACAIGAIAGAAVPLSRELSHLWQMAPLAAAALWLFVLRRNVVVGIVGAGVIGVIAALAGAAVGH